MKNWFSVLNHNSNNKRFDTFSQRTLWFTSGEKTFSLSEPILTWFLATWIFNGLSKVKKNIPTF